MTLPVDRTLDDLWAEAAEIGDVEVKDGYGGDFDRPHNAKIDFKNGAVRVFSKGNGPTPQAALLEAIIEAKRLNGCAPHGYAESEENE